MPTGTITALQTQAHDSRRVNVFIDHEFALGVSLNTFADEELYVGKVVDAAAWERLEAAEYTNKAFQAALRFLEVRPRSVAEVRTRLCRKQLPALAVDAAIQRLTHLGLLDDVAFSRVWVENRQAYHPRGAQALRSELYRKGVDRSVIEATLSDMAVAEDESHQAMKLARAALPRYADAPDQVRFQRRLGGYLQRRGFRLSVVKPILDLLWQEVQGDSRDI